jgi:hypothetical protein
LDIAGAKALKKRLGERGADKASAAPAAADVPEDAPPVFHWFGVGRTASETEPPDAGDDLAAPGVALFRKLGLSFR